MARRDTLSGEPESVGAIWASDHFIEQLQSNGTYEPAQRTDAALAAALVAWRDEVRETPLSPAPRAGDVEIAPRPVMLQPRRIARRGVAAAAVLLAMSSAMATALDADPLKPVRYLVDLGVTVGERIADPVNDPSAEDEPSRLVGEDALGSDGGPRGAPITDDNDSPYLPKSPTAPPQESHATDNSAGEIETAQPTAGPTAGGDGDADSGPSVGDPSDQPTDSGGTEEPPPGTEEPPPGTEEPPPGTEEPPPGTEEPPPGTEEPPPATDPGDTDADGGGDPPEVPDPGADDANAPPGGDQAGVTIPGDDQGATDDQGDGDGSDAQGDSDGSGDQADGDGSGDQADGESDSDGDGDFGDIGGEFGDDIVPAELIGDPSELPNLGTPFADFKQSLDSFGDEHATNGRVSHEDQDHDGRMGRSDQSHSDRTDAWKHRAMIFMTRLHHWA
ncbi:MAG TPA: anti-sigma-D factor RsdA [Nocardioidaceae bacterium]|nr:anti-sigma-D factor RsdA [Nocardioidaceae bacterium]